jgi:hypothetical protein
VIRVVCGVLIGVIRVVRGVFLIGVIRVVCGVFLIGVIRVVCGVFDRRDLRGPRRMLIGEIRVVSGPY